MELDLSLTNDLVVEDSLSAAIQELDILMGTERTQLIGNPKFGLNMEQFLWDLQPSTDQIKDHIRDQIEGNTFWLKQFSYDIDIQATAGTERTIYIVYINIKGIGEDMQEDSTPVIAKKEYTYR